MKKTALLLLIIGVFLLGQTACTKRKTAEIGKHPETEYMRVGADKILQSPMTYMQGNVTTQLKYVGQKQPSPKKDYCLYENETEFSKMYILVNCELWQEDLRDLKKGETFRIYGTVSSALIDDPQKPDIIIEVD